MIYSDAPLREAHAKKALVTYMYFTLNLQDRQDDSEEERRLGM